MSSNEQQQTKTTTTNADNIKNNPFGFSKIQIDDDEKLVAYNKFHEYALKLTDESIKINALIRQVNISLQCIKRRKLLLTLKGLELNIHFGLLMRVQYTSLRDKPWIKWLLI